MRIPEIRACRAFRSPSYTNGARRQIRGRIRQACLRSGDRSNTDSLVRDRPSMIGTDRVPSANPQNHLRKNSMLFRYRRSVCKQSRDTYESSVFQKAFVFFLADRTKAVFFIISPFYEYFNCFLCSALQICHFCKALTMSVPDAKTPPCKERCFCTPVIGTPGRVSHDWRKRWDRD